MSKILRGIGIASSLEVAMSSASLELHSSSLLMLLLLLKSLGMLLHSACTSTESLLHADLANLPSSSLLLLLVMLLLGVMLWLLLMRGMMLPLWGCRSTSMRTLRLRELRVLVDNLVLCRFKITRLMRDHLTLLLLSHGTPGATPHLTTRLAPEWASETTPAPLVMIMLDGILLQLATPNISNVLGDTSFVERSSVPSLKAMCRSLI